MSTAIGIKGWLAKAKTRRKRPNRFWLSLIDWWDWSLLPMYVDPLIAVHIPFDIAMTSFCKRRIYRDEDNG